MQVVKTHERRRGDHRRSSSMVRFNREDQWMGCNQDVLPEFGLGFKIWDLTGILKTLWDLFGIYLGFHWDVAGI